MPHEIAPNLFSAVDHIEEDRFDIASAWIKVPTVLAVFKERRIAPDKFKTGYGVPIIEYFISVVRGEAQAGDCPVMSKLVKFLLDKEITPKEVFDICMGFRRSLIAYLFGAGHIAENADDAMEEVSNLFDANLSGVLDIFGQAYRERQQRMTVLEQKDKKLKQILKIINAIRTKIFIVSDKQILLGNEPFFATFGLDDLDAFRGRYDDSWSFMEAPDIETELFEADKAKWLHVLQKSDRYFKTEIYHHPRKEKLLYSGRVTLLPETEPPQYVVTLTNITSHVEDEARLREQINMDPMTGLSNYSRFEKLLNDVQKEAREDGEELALAIVDVADLKEINDTRGRNVGDDIVMETVQIISVHTNETMLLGRLEGSRFGIVRTYISEQECYDWASRLYEGLGQIGENINVVLTGFDLAESPNRLLMRGFDLAEIAVTLDMNRVHTDFESVDLEVLPDQKPFLEALQQLEELETSIYYKELPILTRNRIVQVDGTGLRLRMARKQFAVMQPEGRVYFRLDKIGFVKARVAGVDVNKGAVEVDRFRYDRHSPLARKKFRVQAPPETMCTIDHDGRDFDGVVVDFNDVAIAVEMPRKKSLEIGSRAKLLTRFYSADNDEWFELDTTVTRIEKRVKGYKIVFSFELKGIDETRYNQYIAQRQMDLIHELKRAEQ